MPYLIRQPFATFAHAVPRRPAPVRSAADIVLARAMSAPRFHFRPNSKFRHKSEVQSAMMEAIRARDNENVIIVAPCGCGKSAVIAEALMEAGTVGLVLCNESQGVYQMADAFLENTSIQPHQLFVYSGKQRQTPLSSRFCYLITTYGMVADTGAHRSEESKRVRNFVLRTKWDMVCCDEFHHAYAPTYRPLVEALAAKARRVVGFTATLFRSELCHGNELSLELEEKAFDWFGPVAHRSKCKDLEDAGLIAKIVRASVLCDFTPDFARAWGQVKGSQKMYLAALNPAKLNALQILCNLHKAKHHVGIVFANHLLVAQVARECLGDGWAVLSGGAAHGDEEHHSAEHNSEIVKAFNAGKLDGMICTAVGESSMDVHIPRFCYVCVLDADAGFASASQRLGRLSRNSRVNARDGESPEQVRQRRLKEQKQACYYELLTRDTTDERAARERRHLFKIEGYNDENRVSYGALLSKAKANDWALPHDTRPKDLDLLKRILMYTSLSDVCVRANAEATERNREARSVVKKHKDAASNSRSSIIRNRHRQKIPGAQKALKQKKEETRAIKYEQIRNQPMNTETQDVFRALNLPLRALAAAGLYEDVVFDLPPPGVVDQTCAC
jgi:superfamily II DNA or RNA helicase